MFVQMTYPAFETKSQVHKPSRTHDDTSGFGNQLAKVQRSKKAREKVNHNFFGTNRHSSIVNDKKRERNSRSPSSKILEKEHRGTQSPGGGGGVLPNIT